MSSLMVVEDDELHRKFLRETVKQSELGLEHLFEASDGREAIKLLEREKIGMLVLDLQMPEKSGVDVARAAWAQDPQTLILFWSNYADEAYVRSIRRVAPPGAIYGYLLKSSSRERLLRALTGVMLDQQMIVDRAISNPSRFGLSSLTELTSAEYEALLDIAIGLTDGAIAKYRGLSVRSVQKRLQGLYAKLGIDDPEYNRRCRAVTLALYERKINTKALEMAQLEWLDSSGA